MSSEFWDDRYRADDFAYGKEPNDFVREVAGEIPIGPVLCLAEGEGRNAVFLAGRGHEVTAVDFATEGLAKAQRLARERNVRVETVLADLATYEPPRSDYAGIVATFAHLPPPVRARVHRWAAASLRPGGVFVLEAYRPAQLAHATGGPRDVALLMTLDDLRRELAALEIVIGRDVDREIREGAFHSGESATVQVLARKSA
ncbi:MAG: class I SAM-dependent methyltransferase [Myxococcales bacterium]|nr:class I SAM-dependent methyltransferase [Myxococcales bacterium]